MIKKQLEKFTLLLSSSLKELNNPSYDITPEVITMYISHLIECAYGVLRKFL